MDYAVEYQTYVGALLVTQLFSSSQTIVLGDFGPMGSGTLQDQSGTLYVGEETVIDGQTYTMLGSGTAQPGVDVLGVTVPLGAKVDLVMLQNVDTGEIIFVYPEGTPDFTGAIALVVNVSPVGYDLGLLDPICFTAGTLIDTPKGALEIEYLCEGDEVLDLEGNSHVVKWVSSRRMELSRRSNSDHLRPVLISRNALGQGAPYLDTRLSQQHRVFIQSSRAQLLFGAEGVFVPAKFLINDHSIRIDQSCETVEYYHILCDQHVVLRANGMAAESLLPATAMFDNLHGAARRELLDIFPDIREVLVDGQTCYPVLRNFEARMLGDELYARAS